jgi:vancomycin resistance protein YoaR
MKRVVGGVSIALAGTTMALTLTGARQAPTIRPNVSVAGVEVGGDSVEDAARKLRVWWESEKLKQLKVHSDFAKSTEPLFRPSEFTVTLDDAASIAKLPLQAAVGDTSSGDYPEQKFDAILKWTGEEPLKFEAWVKRTIGAPRPARVRYVKGVIEALPEVEGYELDKSNLAQAVGKAIKDDEPVELPIVWAPKKIPDEKLAEIKEVVSEFHTHFPKRQFNRNSNIKLASSRLNGVILMPGEQLSFNKTVGERTIKQGFKLAGVYKNGKHDTGIGGGICQVSTTLYNASLFGNLKIVRRSNHSMPVAYVPLGRDATVDFGSLDLVVANDYPTPIAINSEYVPGTLTFRVLGKKVPGETVKIIQVGGKSWDRTVQVIHDPKLKPGATVLVDKGSRGHSIRTYRLVFRNGVLTKKEQLGFSYYGGGDKIIAVGPTPPPVTTLPVMPAISGTKISAPLRRTIN